jgi:hypothetical protein
MCRIQTFAPTSGSTVLRDPGSRPPIRYPVVYSVQTQPSPCVTNLPWKGLICRRPLRLAPFSALIGQDSFCVRGLGPGAQCAFRLSRWLTLATGENYAPLFQVPDSTVPRCSEMQKTVAYRGSLPGALISGRIGAGGGADLRPSIQPRDPHCCLAQHHVHGHL